MQIKRITYRRLWNLGDYENVAVELSADIGEGESIKAALDQLAIEANLWKAKRGAAREGGAA